jgi:hypothetical protein
MSERSERIIDTVFGHWCPVEIERAGDLHDALVRQ